MTGYGVHQTLLIGPLAVPASLLVFMAALWTGWAAGSRIARSRKTLVETELAVLLVAGLLAARMVFVAQYGELYAAAPLAVLDIRDGGWHPLAGLAAAAAAAGILALRRRTLAWPLAVALGTSASVWIVATLALSSFEPPGAGLPRLTLAAISGEQVPLERFKGKPVVLNLWATWCPPCVREMPILERAQDEHQDVHFVFVNQGEQAPAVRAFLARRGIALQNVLLDPGGQVGVGQGHRALPTTLFFDREGRLVDTRSGELSRATLAQRLESLAR
jgi:thiol-disulfide isomerase/thioredoxin